VDTWELPLFCCFVWGGRERAVPLGISVGMPNITLIPQQQKSPTEGLGLSAGDGCELLEVSAVLKDSSITNTEDNTHCGF